MLGLTLVTLVGCSSSAKAKPKGPDHAAFDRMFTAFPAESKSAEASSWVKCNAGFCKANFNDPPRLLNQPYQAMYEDIFGNESSPPLKNVAGMGTLDFACGYTFTRNLIAHAAGLTTSQRAAYVTLLRAVPRSAISGNLVST